MVRESPARTPDFTEASSEFWRKVKADVWQPVIVIVVGLRNNDAWVTYHKLSQAYGWLHSLRIAIVMDL